MQIELFNKQTNDPKPLGDQVVARLILSGVYPFCTEGGKFIYLINEKGIITGTKKSGNFEQKFGRTIVMKGDGQLTNEEKTELDRYNMRSESEPKITEVATGKPYREKTWWDDLYTDATGNCFSDADPSL